MTFDPAEFTTEAASLVAENDRVPAQREPYDRSMAVDPSVIAELRRIAAELDDIAELDRETGFCADEAVAENAAMLRQILDLLEQRASVGGE